MLKRLKTTVFSSEVERFLEKYRIDNSHEAIPIKILQEINALVKDYPKKKNELIHLLYQKTLSQNRTLKIKSLIAVHAYLRNDFNEELVEIVMNETAPEDPFDRSPLDRTEKSLFKSLK